MSLLPPPRDSDPKSLILSSAEPDAVLASLLVARRAAFPLRRIYASEFDLREALARPVVQRMEAGEVTVVGFAPAPGDAERLERFAADRPRVVLRMIDDHFRPPEDLSVLRRCLADAANGIDPSAPFLIRAARWTNGDDADVRRLVGLADGSLMPKEIARWGTTWTRILLAVSADPSRIREATDPLLHGRFEEPLDEYRAAGEGVEGLLNDLARGPVHRFPFVGGDGVLIVAPARPVWPFRELAARVRRRTGAAFSLSCFDGEPAAFLGWGRGPLGGPISETTKPPDAPAVAEVLRAAAPDRVLVRPMRRGEVLLDSIGGAFPPVVAELLTILAQIPSIR